MVTLFICLAALTFGGVSSSALTIVPQDAVEYNGHYYMIYNDLADFEEPGYELAKQFCRRRGGHLAVINDDDENVFLHRLIEKKKLMHVFFGLEYKDGQWHWADDSPYEYEYWADEMSGGENQIHGMFSGMRKDGKWSVGDFSSGAYLYICEWDEGAHAYDYDLEFAKEYVPEHSVEYNGSLYALFNCSLTRNDTANFCRSMGGHLVSITSKEENDFVMELIGSKGKRGMYWIGAYYDSELLRWRWLGDDEFSFRAWNGGNPKFYTYNVEYAAINAALDRYDTGSWVAETVTGRTNVAKAYYTNYGFICEWDIVCGDNFYHGQYDREISVEPTCTSTGLVRCFCTVCDEEIYNTEIPKLAHRYANRRLFGLISVPGLSIKKCVKCGDVVRHAEPKKIWFLPVFLIIMITMIVSFFVTWADISKTRGQAEKRHAPPIWVLLMSLGFHTLTMKILYEIFIR